MLTAALVRTGVTEEIGREDLVARKPRCEPREVPALVPHAVEANDARSARITPLVKRELHSAERRVSSESGTISNRRSSRSFTSDQTTVPSLSIRNVPRCGAPTDSLKTPYAFEASP